MPSVLRYAALLAALLPSFATAQSDPPPARLLKDIGSIADASSRPGEFTRVGAWTWFAATRGAADVELYRTQGRPGTTELFADLVPGPTGSNPEFLTALGARLAFFATVDGETGLWVTDGSSAAPRRVDPGSPGDRPQGIVAIGERLAFTRRLASQSELWVSDGTAPGTTIVPLAVSGLTDLRLFERAATSGAGTTVAYFVTTALDHELWQTDGTPAGTSRVANLGPAGITVISGAAAIRPGLHAIAVRGVRPGILVVDTAAGTSSRLDLPVGVVPLGSATSFAGQAVFPVVDATDRALVTTDGTALTIVRSPRPASGITRLLGAVANTLWMVTPNGRLMTLPPAATMLAEVGSAVIPTASAVQIGSRFYFSGGTPVATLVEVDTATRATRTVQQGLRFEYGEHFGALLFSGYDAQSQSELWRYDPIRGEAALVADINPEDRSAGSSPVGFTRFGERVVFQAVDAESGVAPWISDGTRTGTLRLGDLEPGLGGDQRLEVVGDELWIVAPILTPSQVFRSDGTPSGTVAFATLDAGTPNTRPVSAATALGDAMLFGGRIGGVDGIHHLDGGGTVTTLAPTAGRWFHIVARGSAAFVVAAAGGDVIAVWRTDGTAANTRRLPGDVGRREASSALVFDGRLWVATDTGIFVSDAAGTAMAQFDTATDAYLAAGPQRLFALSTSAIASTSAATTALARFSIAPRTTAPATALALGDRLLFLSLGVPYASDGTTAGTLPLLGNATSADTGTAFHAIGPDRAIFRGRDATSIEQNLFVTDGTAAGTRRFATARVPDSAPTPIVRRNVAAVANGRLFLQIEDPLLGAEPHVVDLPTAVESVGRSCTSDPLRALSLHADRSPVLGAPVRLLGQGAGATSAALWFGLPADRPFALPASGGCSIEVEPTGSTILGPITVDAAGRFVARITVPNDRALLGLAATFQPLFAPGAGTRAVDVGPALRLQLGD